MRNIITILFILVAGAQFASAAENFDAYNSFLWNRSNASARNGEVDADAWYEWWYFKAVDPETREAFFFTYGVVNPWDAQRVNPASGGILQFGSFSDGRVHVQKFPVQDFTAAYNRTYVRLGDSEATDKTLKGHLQAEGGLQIDWDLKISQDWNFNAMGWGLHTKELSGIYWYPAQAAATMSGVIHYGSKTYQLKNAPAYQDRNWGRNFPRWWSWITSNHFVNSPGTAFAAGGGNPVILEKFNFFSGLCLGLRHQGKEYVFRTTDGDSVKSDIHWGRWEIKAQNFKGERIEISAYAPPKDFLVLPFQTPQGQTFYDYEALLGTARIKLYEWSFFKAEWELIADLETHEAGIEWGSPEPLQKLFTSEFSLQ